MRIPLKQKKHHSVRPFSRNDLNLITETFTNFVTLGQLASNEPSNQVTVLRVDVDHDLFGAAKLAQLLQRKAIRATFFIRHDASYSSELFRESRRSKEMRWMRQIVELGHEVGIHNNYLAQSLRVGGSPRSDFSKDISFLRTSGVEITGTSAHGDRLCRSKNFRNVEIFSDRKRWTEETRDAAIEDAVGTVDPTEFGLLYEAYDWAFRVYYCDVGGTFVCKGPGRGTQAPPPVNVRDGENISCILIHPIWWDFESSPRKSLPPSVRFADTNSSPHV